MRMLDVLIVAICMKHRPEQQREITYFFDAWILLLSLVHGKFSWAAGSVMVLLNGFTLHYLSGRLRVMDEVQGSNKKHICIHTIKCFTKERQISFEQRFSWSFPHMVLINSSSLEETKMLLFWGSLLKIKTQYDLSCKKKRQVFMYCSADTKSHYTANRCSHTNTNSCIFTTDHSITWHNEKYLTNTIMVWPLELTILRHVSYLRLVHYWAHVIA